MRDDQFLVSDRSENKFYGTLHGGGTGSSGVAGAVGPSLGYISRRLQVSHKSSTPENELWQYMKLLHTVSISTTCQARRLALSHNLTIYNVPGRHLPVPGHLPLG